VVATALDLNAEAVDVFVTEAFCAGTPDLADRLDASETPQWLISDDMMREISATEHAQGIAMVARTPEQCLTPVSDSFLGVALDGVADPGNVGTIVRAAHAAGTDAVILGPGCCDPFNPKAVRSSAGGVFGVAVISCRSLAEELGKLRELGVQVLGTSAAAEQTHWRSDLLRPTVFLIGNEAHGLSEEGRDCVDGLVSIPMGGRHAESLNAGMAATVLLFEAVRQRSSIGEEREQGRW